ncbi:MAG: hypothetical protein KF779_09115 [Hyphomonadaceae bacterium]|nr:hypothetical protein [Hyphomonadaceae bacterium]
MTDDAEKISSSNSIDGVEPDQLTRSAYHEAGHAVADVGLFGARCFDVRAFAQPTLVHDRHNRPLTVLGLCQTSFGSQSAEMIARDLIQHPQKRASRFAQAVNRVFSIGAGPFAQVELLGCGDEFDEINFPMSGSTDMEDADDALRPFFENEQKRCSAAGSIWHSTREIMRQPNVWAAVEDVADELVKLDGRAPLNGELVHSIIGRHLPLGQFCQTPIVRVEWNGKINRSLMRQTSKP